MKNRSLFFAEHLLLLLVSILLITGCKNDKQVQNTAPPKITVVEVIQRDVPIYNEFVGQIYGQEDVAINARVEGFLTGIHFIEGAQVKKGDLLYSIDPEPFKAAVANQKSLVAEAQTRLINAENELARYKPLAAIDAVSKSDLDFAQANRDASMAGLDAAEASLRMAEINLSYTRIKSPIDGFIGKTNARIGEFVGRSPSVVLLNTASDVSTVRAQFFLTESQYLVVAREYYERNSNSQGSNKAKIEIKLKLSDGTIHPFPGKVDFVNREVDATTGAILVQASFPNPNLILRPGQYTKVIIKMNEVPGALLVPQRCVKEIQGQYSVFVVEEGNKVSTRQIKLGDTIGDLWLVNEGLKPGDKIVIDAIQKVQTGLVVEPELIKFESQSTLQE